METLLSGWLVKSPPERRPWNFLKQQWKKRYFVLCQLFTSSHKNDMLQLALEYYDNENKCCKKGLIDLQNCDDIQSGLRCPPHNFVFSMRTKYRGHQRIYYLAAESFEEMDRWVQSLCSVLNHGKPANQCLRQIPVTSAYELSSRSEERLRKNQMRQDQFHSRRSSFHCSRSGRRQTNTGVSYLTDPNRNDSSEILLYDGEGGSSFFNSTGSCQLTSSQQSSDCYIPLGECYSGLRKPADSFSTVGNDDIRQGEKLAVSDDNFFSSGRYGSLRRKRDKSTETFAKSSIRNSRESRSYSNLTTDLSRATSNLNYRNHQHRAPQITSRTSNQATRPQTGRGQTPGNISRLTVPGKMRTTKTVFLNNSFASSRPFLEPEKNSYINFDSKWERNFRTVPLHPKQSSKVQRDSRWYEKRLDVQLPIRSYNRSFESNSSCDDGDDETSPSTFNEYHSYSQNTDHREQQQQQQKPPNDYYHHMSLHYLDLDLDSCCLDDTNQKSADDGRPTGQRVCRSNRDVTQYCQIDFCKTKGLQDTRIDVESERRNSDRSVDNSNSASFFSVF